MGSWIPGQVREAADRWQRLEEVCDRQQAETRRHLPLQPGEEHQDADDGRPRHQEEIGVAAD